ncbi:MAG TPA: hypothetical protein VD902_18150, partial [Symbiobacteriaceae bacterium]|nr:hypothetical protein [Symbiobacteriaceae bacterium]
MAIHSRPYHGTQDDARVRALVTQSFADTHRWHCWSIEHMEHMRYSTWALEEMEGDRSWES